MSFKVQALKVSPHQLPSVDQPAAAAVGEGRNTVKFRPCRAGPGTALHKVKGVRGRLGGLGGTVEETLP